MVDKETREKYLKACAAFGMDEAGNGGWDATIRECQKCGVEDPVMHAECKAECEVVKEEDKVEKAKKKETKIPVNKTGCGKMGKIVTALVSGKSFTRSELATITAEAGCSLKSAARLVGIVLSFASQAGLLEKNGKSYRLRS